MAIFTLSVAGFALQIRSLFESTRDYCAGFFTDAAAQFHICVRPEDLAAEQAWLDEGADREGLRRRVFTQPFLERNFLQRRVAQRLQSQGVLLAHGSAVAHKGRGYLFVAPCGTGKSTHARLWRETFGAVAVNDDKPFLRLTETEVLLCGSPWQGKHGIGQNITVPLAGICLLRRGSDDRIRPMASEEGYQHLLPHCSGDQAVVDALCGRVPLWLLECTPTPNAAHTARQAMEALPEGAIL